MNLPTGCMTLSIHINDRKIGPGFPAYIVAEMSGNHNQSYEQAVQIIRAAKECGADAIKLQTYTPDTLTIACDKEHFQIGKGTLWEGRTLYDLYNDAFTPWEWQPELKRIAEGIGLGFFSTPFDLSSLEFLEIMDVPAYKIASFELIDLQLIRKVAGTRKPLIMSTGMASLTEIEDAVHAARGEGAEQIALLKCSSAYPAPPQEMNLRTIPHMAQAFGVVAGLSDHTLGIAVPIAAISLGACIIEKHFTLSRSAGGPDSAFSLEPEEFKAMVDAIRTTERALGEVQYEISRGELASRAFRRSLFAVKDIASGELFTHENVRSIRPGNGLAPKHLLHILGRRASKTIERGTPISWDLVG
jgi:pseudaminic acid synthase